MKEILNTKHNADEPYDLIADIADYIQIVGYSTVHNDREIYFPYKNNVSPWKMVSRVLINSISNESRIF